MADFSDGGTLSAKYAVIHAKYIVERKAIDIKI